MIKKETDDSIITLKSQTQQDLDSLRNYVTLLENNINSLQLEQLFIESLSDEQRCEFSSISLDNLMKASLRGEKLVPIFFPNSACGIF